FRGGNFSRAVIEHGLVLVVFLVRKGNDVTAQGNVRIAQGNADGNGFQRGTARVAFARVVAHHGKVCNVAARFETLGNGAAQPHFRFFCKRVDVGFFGGSGAV